MVAIDKCGSQSVSGKDDLVRVVISSTFRDMMRGRYLIVIGALDEAGEAGRNLLGEMLARNAQRLPETRLALSSPAVRKTRSIPRCKNRRHSGRVKKQEEEARGRECVARRAN